MKRLLGTMLAAVVALAACGGSTSDPAGLDRGAAPPPIVVPAAPAGPFLYVTNERGGTVTVIDTATLEPVTTVSLGKRPRGIAVSPDRAHVFEIGRAHV